MLVIYKSGGTVVKKTCQGIRQDSDIGNGSLESSRIFVLKEFFLLFLNNGRLTSIISPSRLVL